MSDLTVSTSTTAKLTVKKGQTSVCATVTDGEVNEITLSYHETAKGRWSTPQFVPTKKHLQELLLAITEVLVAIESVEEDEQVAS